MANGWQSAKEVAKRRKRVLALRAQGRSQAFIADRVGLTQPRVSQIIRDEQKRAEAAK